MSIIRLIYALKTSEKGVILEMSTEGYLFFVRVTGLGGEGQI